MGQNDSANDEGRRAGTPLPHFEHTNVFALKLNRGFLYAGWCYFYRGKRGETYGRHLIDLRGELRSGVDERLYEPFTGGVHDELIGRLDIFKGVFLLSVGFTSDRDRKTRWVTRNTGEETERGEVYNPRLAHRAHECDRSGHDRTDQELIEIGGLHRFGIEGDHLGDG